MLNVRVMLALQDEIVQLEDELADMDERYSQREAADVHNGRFRGDMRDRAALVGTISDKLQRYNALLLQQSSLRQYQKAPKRDIKNLHSWHYNHQTAIEEAEQEYLDHKEDLVCVVHKDETPVRRLINSSKRLRTLSIWRQPPPTDNDNDGMVTYFSDRRMDNFASGVIIGVGMVMLIVPLWILAAMANTTAKLVVITLFVFLFLLILSFAIASKPFEALGATAAYAAVLMVFIQSSTA